MAHVVLVSEEVRVSVKLMVVGRELVCRLGGDDGFDIVLREASITDMLRIGDSPFVNDSSQ